MATFHKQSTSSAIPDEEAGNEKGDIPALTARPRELADTPAQDSFSLVGVIVFQEGKIVYTNQTAVDVLGLRSAEPGGLVQEDFLNSVHPRDCTRLLSLFQSDLVSKPGLAASQVCLLKSEGAVSWCDLIFNQIIYQGDPAVQITIIDASAHRKIAVMRDIMAALASSADLNQALETILVSLRSLIHYDRAGLFLMDEEQKFILADHTGGGMEHTSAFPLHENPVIKDFLVSGRALIVADIQADPRFAGWPEMSPVRGWIGAPLLAGDIMVGFLSLGSLKPGTYDQSHADVLENFTAQLSEVLDKTWVYGRPYRKNGDLEVLRNITFALGQADNRENIISAIITQITSFFGAAKSSFLLPNPVETALIVKYAPKDTHIGLQHPKGTDLLWQVFQDGKSAVISDIRKFLEENQAAIYQALLGGMQTGVLIPIKYVDKNLGILCFAFENTRKFSNEDIKLLNTISDIAGNFFFRAVRMEELEEKIYQRTQHLSSLYDVQALASEPLELEVALAEVLGLTLGTMGCRTGCIHIIDQANGEFNLAAIKNIPAEVLMGINNWLLENEHRTELESTKGPVLVPEFTARLDIPLDAKQRYSEQFGIYIGAPVRIKNQLLGLLSIFWDKNLDQLQEEITFIATIAHQLGNYIDRMRLIHKAEQAAVVEERQRLARELHDSVTQLLYSQVLFAGASKKVLKSGELSLAEAHLSRIESAAQQAMKEMRLLVYELRPSEYLEVGLIRALQRRLDAVENRTEIKARLLTEGEMDLGETKEAALYYIAQEALNNTLKHAGAAEVTILIRSEPERVTLEVIDDGCGFNQDETASGGGMGLTNMRERAAAIGGSLQIITSEGEGTRVVVTIEEV